VEVAALRRFLDYMVMVDPPAGDELSRVGADLKSSIENLQSSMEGAGINPVATSKACLKKSGRGLSSPATGRLSNKTVQQRVK
jgi:hypothetical protein